MQELLSQSYCFMRIELIIRSLIRNHLLTMSICKRFKINHIRWRLLWNIVKSHSLWRQFIASMGRWNSIMDRCSQPECNIMKQKGEISSQLVMIERVWISQFVTYTWLLWAPLLASRLCSLSFLFMTRQKGASQELRQSFVWNMQSCISWEQMLHRTSRGVVWDCKRWHFLVCSTIRFILMHPATAQSEPSRHWSAWIKDFKHRLIASSRDTFRSLCCCCCSCWYVFCIMFEIVSFKSTIFDPP